MAHQPIMLQLCARDCGEDNLLKRMGEGGVVWVTLISQVVGARWSEVGVDM